jgi:hypothetical protein
MRGGQWQVLRLMEGLRDKGHGDCFSPQRRGDAENTILSFCSLRLRAFAVKI